MNVFKIAALVAGIALATHSVPSQAVPFGSSVYINETDSPCGGWVTVSPSIPITVDVSSRIYVTVTGILVNKSAADYYQISYETRLEAVGSTDPWPTGTLSGGGNYLYNEGPQSYTPFADSEILSTPFTAGTFTVAPGNYTLEVGINISSDTGCSDVGENITGYLTYILLSSAEDRIYANGFSMISNADEAVV